MRVLVLGGTRFIGRAVVDALLAQGHALTLLNRGESNPTLYPDIPRIVADRGRLTAGALGDGAWDVALDLSGLFPADVEASAGALRGRVRRYVFCSTCSVYADPRPYPVPEDAPLHACAPEQAVDASMRAYGPRKAECERRLAAICDESGIELFIGRPTAVYGPHDTTDRMRFWLEAVRRGRVVLPSDGMSVRHVVYVEDVAGLFARLATADAAIAGAYNLVGTELFSLRDLVREIAAVVGAEPEIFAVPLALLQARGIRGEVDVPLWVADERDAYTYIMDAARARERLGFRSTPLAEALRRTLAAYEAPPPRPLRGVMDPDEVWARVHAAEGPTEGTEG